MRGRPWSVPRPADAVHAGVLALDRLRFLRGNPAFREGESFFEGLDRQLRRALMTVDWVYHQEPDELKGPASNPASALSDHVDGRPVSDRGVERGGLARALRKAGAMPPESWRHRTGAPIAYRR